MSFSRKYWLHPLMMAQISSKIGPDFGWRRQPARDQDGAGLDPGLGGRLFALLPGASNFEAIFL